MLSTLKKFISARHSTSGIPEVVFVPDWYGSNPYLRLLEDNLKRIGHKVKYSKYPHGFFKLSTILKDYPNAHILHIHWTSGLFTELMWSQPRIKYYIKKLLFAIDLIILKFKGVRLIWTVHNIYEHETRSSSVERSCRRFLYFFANAVIVHSDGAKKAVIETYRVWNQKKILTIPHGHYLDTHACSTTPYFGRERFNITEDKTVFMFFGMMRRYKGIEDILEALTHVTRTDISVILAGHVRDNDLLDKILYSSKRDPRLQVFDYYIPDGQVSSFMAASDVIVLPFRRTLTSGSVIFAMGFSKPLILPKSATILGVPPKNGVWYYSDKYELVDLFESISREDARKRGVVNYEALTEHRWDTVARKTSYIYFNRDPDY